MAPRFSEHLPELPGYTDAEIFGVRQYTRCAVSIFDHWLTEEEARDSKVFSYKLAAAHGLKATYLSQEGRFMAFYKALFAQGAVRATWSGRRGVVAHQKWDRRLKAAVKCSLREQKLFDAYAPAFKLRVLGGFDRTDQLLFEDGDFQSQVSELAAHHGLFLI